MSSKKPDYVEEDFDINFIISSMPGYVYWKDLNSIYRGCNINLAKISNLNSPSDIAGKSDADFEWGKANANKFIAQDIDVITTGKTHIAEEDLPVGNEIRRYRTEKKPLIGKSGKVIGIFGFAVDITAEKKAEQLKLENERHQTALQEKFVARARKVAHDINSPLAAIKMLVDVCHELPEKKRTILRKSTEVILDIANNFLNSYVRGKNPATSEIEQRQPLLLSDQLIQLLSEKKMQFRNQPVTFETVINNDAQFTFAHMQATEFRRSMSNLINNAVDALGDKKNGIVTIKLTTAADSVVVEIQDNGKGMPAGMIEKILNRQTFTAGKENGHGLGLQQVWDTLENNLGKIAVQSVSGQGTSIQLTFPKTATSSWIAKKIQLMPDNIIVILDDDESIHGAWNLRFAPFLKLHSALRLLHFTQGQETLNFLDSLTPQEKTHVVFLSDYELLRQNKNGLQIIEASEINHPILVTSYYSNPKIQTAAGQLGVKILPKQMASVIPIYMKPGFAIAYSGEENNCKNSLNLL